MKVVIVAKTRQGSGACVGGITFDGWSVRLIAADQNSNEQFNMEYNVGDVWDVEYDPAEDIVPPHVENIVVRRKRHLSPLANIIAFIEHRMPPREGGLDNLYEGLIQATGTGALYVAERTGFPPYSTMFWRPDQPLVRDEDAKRIRYRYPTQDGGHTLTFVGFQEPVTEIPAGTLLRVSLAHRWRPQDRPEQELRCYVQLSGWFTNRDLESPISSPQPFDFAQDKPPISSLQATLKKVFGYDSFRPLQAEIINNVLNKRDTLAVMPTGSGKSLCYQLPALLFPGLTVVVSPLISLMQDQVEQLRELGIAAVTLNSTINYDEYLRATTQIKEGAIKLLYLAPETLLRPETLLLLDRCRVDCLTIDEAHCISMWGHDFRPEYRRLVGVRQRLPNAVCIAVTATATQRVRQDIKSSLAVANADEFVASFNRENLFLAVEPKTDGLAQTLAFLETHRDQSGIIYCATRRQVDELAAELASRGWPLIPYHAGLDDKTRRRHQRMFSYDQVPIVVATVAFGMGINKSNVRFILHYNLPKSLESYYQEIGRAGRDGLRADCLLLFSESDVQTINYFIRQQDMARQSGVKLRLQALLRFGRIKICRRRPLLAYFGEAYEAKSCNLCDNCLKGKSSPAAQLPRQGRGRHNIVRAYLKQTARTDQVSYQQKGSRASPLSPPAPFPRPQEYPVHDPALFFLLHTKRKMLAEEIDISPYAILSDRSLVEMATYFPQSPPAFATIYGVSESKLAKYANEFLPVIQEYCLDNRIPEKPKPAGTTPAGRETVSHSKPVNDLIQHVVALGNSGNPANVPELIGTLDHPNGNVRRLAASALGKLRDKRAVQPLLDLLVRERKPQVRQYTVRALGRIGDDRALATLQQIATNEEERYYTRHSAKVALRRLRKFSSGEPPGGKTTPRKQG